MVNIVCVSSRILKAKFKIFRDEVIGRIRKLKNYESVKWGRMCYSSSVIIRMDEVMVVVAGECVRMIENLTVEGALHPC